MFVVMMVLVGARAYSQEKIVDNPVPNVENNNSAASKEFSFVCKSNEFKTFSDAEVAISSLKFYSSYSYQIFNEQQQIGEFKITTLMPAVKFCGREMCQPEIPICGRGGCDSKPKEIKKYEAVLKMNDNEIYFTCQ